MAKTTVAELEKRMRHAEAAMDVTAELHGTFLTRLGTVEDAARHATEDHAARLKAIEDKQACWGDPKVLDVTRSEINKAVRDRLEAVEKALECQREGKHVWLDTHEGLWSRRWLRVRVKITKTCVRCGTHTTKKVRLRGRLARRLHSFICGKD